MSSSAAPQLLSRAMSVPQADGSITIRIANPLTETYLGLPPAGTLLPGEQGPNVVLSVQPDGSLQARPAGANGAYEKAKPQAVSGLLVWKPEADNAFALPFTE